jgi:iron complex outermembrane receptor protein
VEAGYGTYATNDLRASVNAGSERLGLVAYGNAYDTDGYRDNNAFRQRNMLANVRYAGESGSIGARIGASDQNLRLPGALTEAEIAANPRQSDTPDNFSKFNGALAALNGAYRTGDVELAADLAYRDTVSEANFAGAFPSYLQSSSHTTQFSPRARWDLARLGADSQFVAGVDWFDASFTRRIADTSSDLNAPFSQVESTQRASAGYTQFLWQVTERTRVNLGARVARVETDLRTVIPGPIAVQDQSRTLNAYEGALRYALSSLVSISGRLSRSYRLPTVDENGFTSTGLLLEPQTAKQGDVGVELRASTFSARATAYLIKLHNEIYFSPLINPPFGANTNLPPTERRGLELAARWVSTPMLELGGSLNLQQATYSSGVLGGVDLSGKDVPLVPRVLGTLRASWLFQPQARLSATYTYVGHERYDNDQANTYPQEMPTYGLLDLKLSYDIDRWLLAASVANALNQHYYSYGIVNLSNCPTFCAYPQAGRTFFASVEYRFR